MKEVKLPEGSFYLKDKKVHRINNPVSSKNEVKENRGKGVGKKKIKPTD